MSFKRKTEKNISEIFKQACWSRNKRREDKVYDYISLPEIKAEPEYKDR
jgi:hypothetical protein